MSDPELDDLEILRSELRRMGVPGPSAPQDFGLEFAPVDDFFDPAPKSSASRFRYRKWVPSGMIAAAAAILAIALLAPGGPVDKRPSAPTTTVSPQVVTVARVLRQAATVSAGLPDESAAPFWRVDSVQQQGDNPPENRTVWLGRTQPGLVVDDFGRAELPPAVFGLQGTILSWEELLALPTNPADLRAIFDREIQGGSNPDLVTAKLAAYLLAESPAPPGVRKALWQVISGVRGVVALGTVKDMLGRTGFGLTLGTPSSDFAEYIVDPDQGRILQATTRTGKAGADLFRVTYLDQGPAAQIPVE